MTSEKELLVDHRKTEQVGHPEPSPLELQEIVELPEAAMAPAPPLAAETEAPATPGSDSPASRTEQTPEPAGEYPEPAAAPIVSSLVSTSPSAETSAEISAVPSASPVPRKAAHRVPARPLARSQGITKTVLLTGADRTKARAKQTPGPKQVKQTGKSTGMNKTATSKTASKKTAPAKAPAKKGAAAFVAAKKSTAKTAAAKKASTKDAAPSRRKPSLRRQRRPRPYGR
jgi:hypothetical protein